MRLRTVFVLSCVAGTLLSGCARRAAPTDELADPAYEPPPVILEVQNNNWNDVAIYVVRGSQRVRVMTIVAINSESVILPKHLLGPGGEIRVLAYPIGGYQRYASPRVYAQPGTTVAVTLETDLRRSSVAVW
jgi:hypothetical protein